ncbi:MAG: hypothetical protein Q9167_002555 [Letrouitia subvulpina]
MHLRSTDLRLLPASFWYLSRPQQSLRQLHRQVSVSQIPAPIPFVPDVKTFLTLIGRNLLQHANKISSWESLFSLSSSQLRQLGVEPARTRRYLLWWRERFRKGQYGIGGDLSNVKDAVAEVRVVEVPKDGSARPPIGLEPTKKIIVNIPQSISIQGPQLRSLRSVNGLRVSGARKIVGPYVQPVKGTDGSVATLKVQKGMWEQKRGHKVDGGERRQKEIRRKRRQEEEQNAGK